MGGWFGPINTDLPVPRYTRIPNCLGLFTPQAVIWYSQRITVSPSKKFFGMTLKCFCLVFCLKTERGLKKE